MCLGLELSYLSVEVKIKGGSVHFGEQGLVVRLFFNFRLIPTC